MKIGELAQAAGSTVETVRYYEKEGLLPAPERNANNYRSYGAAHVERLRLIRNCRALDMTHDEIRALLALFDRPQSGCSAAHRLFDQHIGHVDARIKELTRLREQLQALRERCATDHSDADDCGILHGVVEMEMADRPERHTHLG